MYYIIHTSYTGIINAYKRLSINAEPSGCQLEAVGLSSQF